MSKVHLFGMIGLLSSLTGCALDDATGGEGLGLRQVEQASHEGEAACVAPQVGPAWGWDAPNEITGTNDVYITPTSNSGSAAAAQLWLESVTPRMPLLEPDAEPFFDSTVRVAGGWYYGFSDSAPDDGFHGAIDYVSTNPAGTDPTHGVTAVAAGTVIAAAWHELFGNTVVVEHTAPDGTRYRSIYCHLRDGATHDCQESKAFVSSDPSDPNNRETRFQEWMETQDCAALDPIIWGTDAHTISVNAGDTVSAGQALAWSGATGHGGIGNAIAAGGVLTDTVRGNNHLHLHLAVFDSVTGNWTLIDPYGVYNDNADGCYGIDEQAGYARMLAPFYPSFNGVPLATFSHHFSYYPSMGFGLQTVSPYAVGADYFAAGAYDPGLSPVWKAGVFRITADYQAEFDQFYAEGLEMRELSVTLDGDGEPRFTHIWKERTSVSWGAWGHLTDAEYDQKWQELVVQGGHRIADHAAYTYEGVRQHAAIFVKDGVAGWHAPYGYSAADFDAFAAARVAEGFEAVSVSAEETPGGTAFGGVFLPVAGDWVMDRAIPSVDYQSRFNTMFYQGYRLYRIQGYDDGSAFAAVWTKGGTIQACTGAACILGFESVVDWTSTNAVLGANLSRFTEGSASLDVRGSGFLLLQSSVLGAGVIPANASTMAFDLFIPSTQPNPWWIGGAQAYLECPSVALNNAYVGQVELTPLARGVFTSLSFPLSAFVRSKLALQPSDCFVRLALNVNPTADAYSLDRLRFQ